MHEWIKLTHVSLAVLSASGFVVRSCWMLLESPLLETRLIRTLPHLVDALLLLSGLTLAVRLQVTPLGDAWFGAKMGALVLYIVAGSVALRRGRTRKIRGAALAVALASLAYIFTLALTRQLLAGY